MRAIAIGLAAVALAAAPAAGQAQDLRELVTMPPQVQESLLMNMQDHLVALDTIISHVASERFTEAARVADQRLRFSNPEGEAAITDWFPPEMLGAKDALRAAATRFANAAKKSRPRPRLRQHARSRLGDQRHHCRLHRLSRTLSDQIKKRSALRAPCLKYETRRSGFIIAPRRARASARLAAAAMAADRACVTFDARG
ncbi:hypothetical protein [Magnetospirillum fulvum]|uniref:Uncharacterized protein n=1 Tax=Magnetospirillum fulvum MGU-K5 TaxID=1316936 RepID=S9S980_MAGFU|nr:hypothetical protein [Magnetospirillum fulvum]EPY01249.1 hypothetical protein K678_11840 [Magnetospirillum fulvum MGU-K5]